MLVLTRKLDQAIVIDGKIIVRVTGIANNQVRLTVEAPRHISVHRREIQRLIDRENAR